MFETDTEMDEFLKSIGIIMPNQERVVETDMLEARKRRLKFKKTIEDPVNRAIRQKKIEIKAMIRSSLFAETLTESINPISNYTAPKKIGKDQMKIYAQFKSELVSYSEKIKEGVRPGHNIVLKGKPGTGKTYFALSMMNELVRSRHSVLYLNMSALRNLLYDFGSSRTRDKVERIRRLAKKADLLILDDLGTETDMTVNGYSAERVNTAKQTIQLFLYDIMNVRQERYTMITTNLVKENIDKMYNDKLFSRMFPKRNEHILDFDRLVDLRNRD